MNKRIFLVIVSGLFLVLAGTVLAASPSVYVSPASGYKTVGSTLGLSVGVATDSDSVCVVRGTLVFNNLSCNNITVAQGVMAAVTPTCSNPSFILGIPKCTNTNKTLLALSLKGSSEGQATVSFSGVKIIGAGTILSNNSNVGKYNITSLTKTPTTTEEVLPELVELPVEAQPAGLTAQTGLPAGVGSASLMEAINKFIKNPYIIIVVLIVVLLLLGLWVYDKFYSKKKNIKQ
jgi:hypothetical protein